MTSATVVYADQPETVLFERASRGSKKLNHVLMGTWLQVVSEEDVWYRVQPRSNRGSGGWVLKADTRPTPALKVFVVDVGQGDGAIVEAPNGRILIDGGPNKGFHRFLRHRYWPILRDGERVHFDAVVVSHPDTDHYRGITHALNDRNFTFGTLYHNGIIRYASGSSSGRLFDLGRLNRSRAVLTETFSSLNQAGRLIDTGQLMTTFRDLLTAAWNANVDGRLGSVRRLTSRDRTLPDFSRGGQDLLKVQVLGPVPTASSGSVRFKTFPSPHHPRSKTPSSSHTRNGHSIVLKMTFGDHSFLFGGDLNIPAHQHLMSKYRRSTNTFRSTVAKACHHGSSDFSVEFLKLVRPRVNVFSSGDNKSFDHPTADAVGASARWATGDIPLFFSTELGRAVSSSGNVHYGLINFRSNGRTLVAAQMKEQHNGPDVWDSFTVPWPGKFPDAT